MASTSSSRVAKPAHRKRRVLSGWIAGIRRAASVCRRALLAVAAAPLPIRILAGVFAVFTMWFAINWGYQIVRKPTELFFPMRSVLVKTPPETWRQYGALFNEHSTAVITPPLLAALAQIEGGGNPLTHTYWRSGFTLNPLQLYRPASSAVGMFQITDAAFREAKHYCIHNHMVVEEGSWNDLKSCWFNSLYTRILPGHAIEMTAAMLDRGVASAMGHRRNGAVTLRQKQDLAALIHLCGAGAGDAYAARGFRLTDHQRCGDHDVTDYLARVHAMKRQFAKLAASD